MMAVEEYAAKYSDPLAGYDSPKGYSNGEAMAIKRSSVENQIEALAKLIHEVNEQVGSLEARLAPFRVAMPETATVEANIADHGNCEFAQTLETRNSQLNDIRKRLTRLLVSLDI